MRGGGARVCYVRWRGEGVLCEVEGQGCAM